MLVVARCAELFEVYALPMNVYRSGQALSPFVQAIELILSELGRFDRCYEGGEGTDVRTYSPTTKRQRFY
jgi:hypothetical protein